MSALSIGRVAKRTGLQVGTVRFYESRGLIAEPQRKESGYRQYREDVIPRLRFVKRAKILGFSLEEIRDLLELGSEEATTCAEVRAKAEGKMREVSVRIAALDQVRKALSNLVVGCEDNALEGECPFLEALFSIESEVDHLDALEAMER